VRHDESDIDTSGAESAGVAEFDARQRPPRKSELVKARPWQQYELRKPLIGWMSD
jgi:hypothetical protein